MVASKAHGELRHGIVDLPQQLEGSVELLRGILGGLKLDRDEGPFVHYMQLEEGISVRPRLAQGSLEPGTGGDVVVRSAKLKAALQETKPAFLDGAWPPKTQGPFEEGLPFQRSPDPDHRVLANRQSALDVTDGHEVIEGGAERGERFVAAVSIVHRNGQRGKGRLYQRPRETELEPGRLRFVARRRSG